MWSTAAVIATLGLFIGACFLMFRERLHIDSYAPGSSLRTDPQGTSVFFNSMAAIGVQVTREYDSATVSRLDPTRSALFFITPRGGFDPEIAADLLRFTSQGGRLVITGAPMPVPLRKEGKNQQRVKPLPPDAADHQFETLDVWQALRIGGREDGHDCMATRSSVTTANELTPPDSVIAVPVASRRYLDLKDAAWQPIYRCGAHVIMATRTYGKGSVVVASDSSLISNQQLSERLDAALMLWLAGGRSRIAADEAYHQLMNNKGFGWLIRRYRLGPAVLGLAVLFLLGIWGEAPALMRPIGGGGSAYGGQRVIVALESQRAGYVRLLERAVPRKKLLATCVHEWLQDSGTEDASLRRLSDAPLGDSELVARFDAIAQRITESQASPIVGAAAAGFAAAPEQTTLAQARI